MRLLNSLPPKSRSRPRVARRPGFYRPQLLALEERLSLGDALLGALLGSSLAAPSLAALAGGLGVSANVAERVPVRPGQTQTVPGSAQEAGPADATAPFASAPSGSRADPFQAQARVSTGAVGGPGAWPAWETASAPWQEWATLAALATAPVQFTGLGPSQTGSAAGRHNGSEPVSAGSSRPVDMGLAAPPSITPALLATFSLLPSPPAADPGTAPATPADADFLEESGSASGPDWRCTVALTPSAASPQLVGQRLTWTATPTHCPDTLVYQFSVRPHGGPARMLRDFSPNNAFAWAPMQEGAYRVRATVKDGYEATRTRSVVVSHRVDSRVTGAHAVVTPTPHPLVALYSAPACARGSMSVEFAAAGPDPVWKSTEDQPCVRHQSRNFLVAGMLPDTTYQLRHVLSDGTTSAPLLFTTGSLPATLTFPTFTVRQPPGPGSDFDLDMVLHAQVAAAGPNSPSQLATDLLGRVTWYVDPLQSGLIDVPGGFGLELGGTLLVTGNDRYSRVLREIDLAGNPLRETNVAAVNPQLTALGHGEIFGFHHDAQRLPNGHTAVVTYTHRCIPRPGATGSCGDDLQSTLGDGVVVLDTHFQVAWAWDAFDHLDVNRDPILGETCASGQGGCPAEVPHSPAVDWTHANAVAWSPADGNLILSVRHQDWVIKIDYQGGSGDGQIVWRLGPEGDFAVDSPDPFPWNGHQHNAHYVDATTLVLYDNGNTRCRDVAGCNSRGQAWTLDEEMLTATPVLNADLGHYSGAVGAAQRLSNGNYSFTSGQLGQPPDRFGQTTEVLPDGTKTYVLEVARQEYRSFRVRTLYAGTSP